MLLVAHRTPTTRAACEDVAAAGARVFEADVQVDDEDRVVVSHYLPFARFLHHDNWRIRWHTGRLSDPRLDDITAVVPADCLVLLDLKETRRQRRSRLVAALSRSLPDRSRFRVCGHLADDLDELRAAGFRTWRTARDRRELAAVLDGGPLADEAVSIRHSLLVPDVVDRLHEHTRTVVAWTVNEMSRARQLRSMGVDGVTTDRMSVMRAMATLE